MSISLLAPTTQRVTIPGGDGGSLLVPGSTPVKTGRLKDGRVSLARGGSYRDDAATSVNELARALTTFPALWEAASNLPRNSREPGAMGRPISQPDFVYFYAASLVFLLGSQRGVIAYLQDRHTWRHIRRHLNRNLPAGFDRVSKRPPNLNGMRYFMRKVRTDASYNLDAIFESVRDAAREQALSMGLLSPEREWEYANPDGGRVVAYDGTVFPAASRYARGNVDEDGTVHRAADGVGMQLKGGDQRIMGLKIAFGSVRTNDHGGRVILDARQVLNQTEDGIGDESAYIVESALYLQANLPGMWGIVSDGILGGTHHAKLSRRGLFAVSPVTAKKNPNAKTGGRFAEGRVEKTMMVGSFTHTRVNGTKCIHEVYSVGGNLCESKSSVDGEPVLTPVATIGLERRENKDGTFRIYQRLQIPCRHGDLKPRINHMHTPPHGPQFNRGEYLRPYQPNSDAFTYLYGRRNDTESLHNEIKLKIRRMPAYDARNQLLLIIGLVILQNAKTAVFERKRTKRAASKSEAA